MTAYYNDSQHGLYTRVEYDNGERYYTRYNALFFLVEQNRRLLLLATWHPLGGPETQALIDELGIREAVYVDQK